MIYDKRQNADRRFVLLGMKKEENDKIQENRRNSWLQAR